MRRVDVIVAGTLASSLALLQCACVLNGKAKTSTAAVAPPQPAPVAAKPSPPPEPLSVPQTQVQLPPPQPVNPDALPPLKPAAEPPAAATPRAPRRSAPPKPEPPAPAAAAPAAATPEPAPIQEVLAEDEKKRLQESANSQKTEIRHVLTLIKSHHPTGEVNREVKRIQSLVAQSDDAEKRGDMRQADALAERALILARGLNGGK
jgi:hypothetical protein